MRKVIDLCLDMPMGAEALTNMLGAMCLDPLYRGYKKTYGAGVAAQVGLTVEEIDAIYESEGRDGFLRIIREAAEKHAVKPAEFVRHLDEVGVEWGITCDGDHDNRKTAEIVQAFPKKFKGFIYVDPNRGEEAVRELEVCVKEYGLHALYLTAFRTKLNAADKKNYPLYSKACELGIPVHIYSSLNLSKAVPYDIGHPRYIDQVARDFPKLKIMAGVSGWPWVLDFLCLAIRHENVYLNFETHAPEKIAMRGSGYEPYLYYGETSLKERITLKYCHAANTPATVRFPQYHYNMVRSLLLLVGYDWSVDQFNRLGLEKVLYWRGFVAQINEVKAGERFDYGLALTASRDMKVAVTSFGYSDGYPDDLPGNGGFVMIKGQKAPILSLNMDQGFVDITDIPDVCVNDQMLLIGQDGDEEVELTELLANSKHSGTYFFSLINHRVRRIFKR